MTKRKRSSKSNEITKPSLAQSLVHLLIREPPKVVFESKGGKAGYEVEITMKNQILDQRDIDYEEIPISIYGWHGFLLVRDASIKYNIPIQMLRQLCKAEFIY